MIDINFYPPNLRKKKTRAPGAPGKGLSIPKEVIIGLGGGFVVVLLIVHVILQSFIFSRYGKHKALTQEWEEILPSKRRVDVVVSRLRGVQAKAKSIQNILPEEQILWSKKLNIVSDNIPRGVWLRKIAFADDILFIEGSAVSKGQDEMISVHRFASNLKSQEDFLENLTDLELGSIQRRKIKDVDIADFSIKAKVK